MRILTFIFILISISLLQNCAQISAPTGGDEDSTPPQLDSANTFPSNFSTNFSEDKITLTFNEYFVIKNPKANVLISPSLEKDPEFITTGKTLTILLKNELKENTTYTINFGDAISDYTVGNKIPDFKYVFSTGDFLDSMSASGKIIDAFSGEPLEDAIVMMYDSFSDSIVTNSKPIYYAKTNKSGTFNIQYIKAGLYKIVALKDENRNYKYDLPNEKIGAIDSLLNLKDTNRISSISIRAFERDHKAQTILSKKYVFPGKLILEFQKRADTVLVKDENGKGISFHSQVFSANRDTLILWKPEVPNTKNKLRIRLDTTDKLYNVYGFVKPKRDTGLNARNKPKSIDVNRPLVITFDRPIQAYDALGVNLYKDSLKVVIDSVTINNRSLSLYFNKKEEEDYRYELLSGAVTDIFGYQNMDTISSYLTIRKNDFYGIFTLKFNPKNDTTTYVIQLMNEKGDLIQKKSTIGKSKVTFNHLTPGKYKIKAIEDVNSNGNWDTGDYYRKLKPESVFFLNTPIEIRSNWEVAESWEIE